MLRLGSLPASRGAGLRSARWESGLRLRRTGLRLTLLPFPIGLGEMLNLSFGRGVRLLLLLCTDFFDSPFTGLRPLLGGDRLQKQTCDVSLQHILVQLAMSNSLIIHYHWMVEPDRQPDFTHPHLKWTFSEGIPEAAASAAREALARFSMSSRRPWPWSRRTVPASNHPLSKSHSTKMSKPELNRLFFLILKTNCTIYHNYIMR